MKKTIAILLVLVIAMAGVFAEDPVPTQTTQTAISKGGSSAALAITTTVPAISALSITAAEFTGTTLAAWNSQAVLQTIAVSSNPNTVLAYMNLIHNTRSGVAVYASASKMASTANSATNKYVIGYTAKCNGESIVAGATVTTNDVTATEKKLVVSAGNSVSAESLFIESYGITVTLDATSFDNAPADSYTGTITFDFVSQT